MQVVEEGFDTKDGGCLLIMAKKIMKYSAIAFGWNMLLVYISYMLCRVCFVLENWNTYSHTLFDHSWSDLLRGSLLFDTSAILYTNAIYALLMLIPLHHKESHLWQRTAKWIFLVINGLCVCLNMADAVYFQFSGKRTTMSVFTEFGNENNLGSIFGTEILRHWYIVLAGICIIWLMYRLYATPGISSKLHGKKDSLRYYGLSILAFALYIPLTIAGMRGGFAKAIRPITISNANMYVTHPAETAIILNTPFSMIRTVSKKNFALVDYMSEEEMDELYSPLHIPQNDSAMIKKNVVILIVESFGREYIGAYNEQLDSGKYMGYTPFIDKLYRESMSFDYTFSNGRKSIDGMPSILSSIPMFVEHFFLTPATLNDLSGIAGELGSVGYSSAFFHGAENTSMGFNAFAKSTGFQEYYGRTEYNEDKRFNGDKDFDGTWAIWDEPFLQFYATKMSEMKEPFVTTVFTASSHHPFVIPDKYKDLYPDDENPIHKCIRYTDHALELFFETAKKQPWFQNTIFAITSDHTNMSDHKEYQTDLGVFGSPILFYDPSGKMFPPGRRHSIAQQIDIMPTILSALRYDKPYVAFGKDLLSTPDSMSWAINYHNGIYQYIKGEYLLQFDGMEVTGLYDIHKDWLQQHNIKGAPVEERMTKETKAIIQSYMDRMVNNKLK